ncbi:MAG: DUF2946 domain-containing protein [Rhodoferax sp.]|nr:MAG: DUF2946 domain-containing protein [Rhodoferax sp.]
MACTRSVFTHHSGWKVWWAVFSFVFAAFAPTLTHAFTRALPTLPLEICTSAGAVATYQPASPQDEGGAMQSLHCPFCLQNTDRGAPPPQPLPYHFLVQGGSQVSMVWQAFFFLDIAPWLPQVRGPPL